MIIKEVKQYPIDYLVLLVGLSVVAVLFFRFSHLPGLQEMIISLGAGMYVLWGIVHHWFREDLCLKIVLEYFFIGLFVVGAGFFVLGRI